MTAAGQRTSSVFGRALTIIVPVPDAGADPEARPPDTGVSVNGVSVNTDTGTSAHTDADSLRVGLMSGLVDWLCRLPVTVDGPEDSRGDPVEIEVSPLDPTLPLWPDAAAASGATCTPLELWITPPQAAARALGQKAGLSRPMALRRWLFQLLAAERATRGLPRRFRIMPFPERGSGFGMRTPAAAGGQAAPASGGESNLPLPPWVRLGYALVLAAHGGRGLGVADSFDRLRAQVDAARAFYAPEFYTPAFYDPDTYDPDTPSVRPGAEARIAEDLLPDGDLPSDTTDGDRFGLWLAHGLQRLERAELPEAEIAFRAALTLDPAAAAVHSNLAIIAARRGALEAAEAGYCRALTLDPAFAAAWNNRALVARGRHCEGAAMAMLRQALALDPAYAGAWNNLGITCQSAGHIAEALAAYRRALTVLPDFTDAHSNLILALDYDPAADTAVQQAECHRWYLQHGRVHAAAVAARSPQYANSPVPNRVLRVGYLSPDFRAHPVADVLLPVLEGHDRAAIQVTCYSGVVVADAVTARFQQLSDHWCDTTGLDDAALTTRIQEDDIDILVNLPGHGHGNRLGVFARKPAPVQISAWGLPRGTGLPTIDALLVDPVMVPPDEAALFAERVEYLPCWLAYAPPAEAPAVGRDTADTAPLTFGCLNRLEKLSAPCVALWADLLHHLPDSRLLCKSWGLREAEARQNLVHRFAAHGIPDTRLILQGGDDNGRAGHLATYRKIDLSLDPYPHGGGVSTLDSLWMGVPVISLRGRTPAARGSVAILHALGLEDGIVDSPATYRARAITLALAQMRDRARAPAARTELRARLAGSILCDSMRYAAAVEGIYRRLWQQWCASSARCA